MWPSFTSHNMEVEKWRIKRAHPDGERFDILVTKKYNMALVEGTKSKAMGWLVDMRHTPMPERVEYIRVADGKHYADIKLHATHCSWARQEWVKTASVTELANVCEIDCPRDEDGLLFLKDPCLVGKIWVQIKNVSDLSKGNYTMYVTGVQTVIGVMVDDVLMVDRSELVVNYSVDMIPVREKIESDSPDSIV